MNQCPANSKKPPTLTSLRAELCAACDISSLEAFAVGVARDRRSGARALGERARRRASKLRAENRRLAGLFRLRRSLRQSGLLHIAGVDEVGMGPLAGPVVAAAVILPDETDLPGLDDSKRVPRETREALARAIRQQATAYCVAWVTPEEIDRINIYQAGLRAMARAVGGLSVSPEHVLVDARRIPGLRCDQTPLVRGDSRDASIAAASILAKVERDLEMQRLDRRFPDYGFAKHKGYPTPEHLAALVEHGPSSVHRRSFAPVASAAG